MALASAERYGASGSSGSLSYSVKTERELAKPQFFDVFLYQSGQQQAAGGKTEASNRRVQGLQAVRQ